jgi:hypothetical protein
VCWESVVWPAHGTFWSPYQQSALIDGDEYSMFISHKDKPRPPDLGSMLTDNFLIKFWLLIKTSLEGLVQALSSNHSTTKKKRLHQRNKCIIDQRTVCYFAWPKISILSMTIWNIPLVSSVYNYGQLSVRMLIFESGTQNTTTLWGLFGIAKKTVVTLYCLISLEVYQVPI